MEASINTNPFNPFDPALPSDPHPVYHRARSASPTQFVEMFGMWVALGYDGVQSIMRNTAAEVRYTDMQKVRQGEGVVDEPYFKWLQHFVLFKEGSDHRRIRMSFSRRFVPPRVDRIRPRMQARAVALIDAIAEDGEADLVEAFTRSLPLTTISELLGVPPKADARLEHWIDAFRPAIVFTPMSPEQLAAANDAITGLTDYFAELVVERRAYPQDDLLTALIAEADDGNLTEEELIANAAGLYFAGHDTSTHALGNAFITLFRYPEALARVRDDLSLVPAAVDEILRYEHPAAAGIRVLVEDTAVEGSTVTAGCPVAIYVAAANRDPCRFANPDTFDLDRTEKALSFGVGPHVCPGQHLARATMTIALTEVLTRLPNLRLAVADAEIEWHPSPILHGPAKLPVRWDVP